MKPDQAFIQFDTITQVWQYTDIHGKCNINR